MNQEKGNHMKLRVLTIVLAGALAAACGGGGVEAPIDEDTGVGADVGEDSGVYGCTTADECKGKFDPNSCQKVDCVQNQCLLVPVTNGTACDDSNVCTEADQCFQGECQGAPKECSDGNLCTDDSCDPASGQCVFAPNTKPCDDGNPCTSPDTCGNGVCVGGASICNCTTNLECEKYDDANKCNGIVTCQAGECKTDPTTLVDCSGAPAGVCETAYCDEADGQCKAKPKNDGAACDDSDMCTSDTTCQAGKCTGSPVKCDDADKCSEDACDPAKGCVYTPVADGSECSDGSLCTSDDKCVAGKCTGTPVPECDSCTADADCAEYEDGNLCNGLLICKDGSCVVNEATIVTCSAGNNPCQESKCVPATGKCENTAALDGTACDDLNFCTHSDFCTGGVCKGLPVDCEDKTACTQDSCDPNTGCVHAPKEGSCGDSDPCTQNDHCVNGVCVGDPIAGCSGCEKDEDCAPFDDADLCNGKLFCKNKKCQVNPDTVVSCADPTLDPCKSAACNPETGACVFTDLADATPCDDKTACTEADKCLAGVCKGVKLVCDDGNLCTDDACDPKLGCVYSYNSIDCDDGSPCTPDDHCEQGLCVGTVDPSCVCTKNEECAKFEDGNKCNGTLICKGAKCVIDPATIVTCDTSKDTDCKVTFCNKENGKCEQAAFADGKPCDDSNKCTQKDSCKGGACAGTANVTCDDTNPCTNDSCDPQLGCIAVPNTAACDDKDPCTGGDKCQDGVCQPGTQNLCADTCKPDWTLKCGGTDTWGNDKSGATDVVTTYGCSPFDYTGPEYTYTFKAPYDATVTVALSGEKADTDVIVLEAAGQGCDPDQCRDWDYSSVTFEAEKDKTYYFVVDGYEGGVLPAAGAYTIKLTCQPLTEINCADGKDDDGDGKVDCKDDDCLGTVDCPAPICKPSWNLYCGKSDSWANYGAGSTDAIETYNCNDYEYPGPEYTYAFVAPVTGKITITLTDETAETDVLVVAAGAEGQCLPTGCIAYGLNDVTFDAKAGTTYYVVVDGWAGAEGSYTITVECPPNVELDCADGKDNDGDTKTDCKDEDCFLSDACTDDCNPTVFPFEVGCGFEEDYYTWSWLATDKADKYSCIETLMDGPEYVYNFVPEYDTKVTVFLTKESAETSILIVEADAQNQCLTTNCIGHGKGQKTFDAKKGKLYYLIVDGAAGAVGSYHIKVQCNTAKELLCDDGLDNDEDTLVDCLDGDCFGTAACEPACVPDTVPEADLTCNSTDSWSNDGGGSSDLIDYYSCNGYYYPAPEYTYTLTVTQKKSVTVTLSNEETDAGDPAELDLLVLQDAGLGCNPASCITYGLTSATFTAEPGKTYYVVVDGYAGDVGNYDLAVTCK